MINTNKTKINEQHLHWLQVTSVPTSSLEDVGSVEITCSQWSVCQRQPLLGQLFLTDQWPQQSTAAAGGAVVGVARFASHVERGWSQLANRVLIYCSELHPRHARYNCRSNWHLGVWRAANGSRQVVMAAIAVADRRTGEQDRNLCRLKTWAASMDQTIPPDKLILCVSWVEGTLCSHC